jgi:hypothetical protein
MAKEYIGNPSARPRITLSSDLAPSVAGKGGRLLVSSVVARGLVLAVPVCGDPSFDPARGSGSLFSSGERGGMAEDCAWEGDGNTGQVQLW